MDPDTVTTYLQEFRALAEEWLGKEGSALQNNEFLKGFSILETL
jgi:hypothetical protein